MANSQARRRAKASAQGQRQLPRSTTGRARRAATFIGPYRDLSDANREALVKIKLADWWNDDYANTNDNYRYFGTAEDVYNYAVSAGSPDAKFISIIPSDTHGEFFVYMTRDSG